MARVLRRLRFSSVSELVGVIFFLYRLKDILLYVSPLTVGHSLTLLGGALGGVRANAYIVDAVIDLSIVYKAFENMGGFQAPGFQPNTRVAVFAFGLVHGFRPRNQTAGVLALPQWDRHEHRQLQRRRRDVFTGLGARPRTIRRCHTASSALVHVLTGPNIPCKL